MLSDQCFEGRVTLLKPELKNFIQFLSCKIIYIVHEISGVAGGGGDTPVHPLEPELFNLEAVLWKLLFIFW